MGGQPKEMLFPNIAYSGVSGSEVCIDRYMELPVARWKGWILVSELRITTSILKNVSTKACAGFNTQICIYKKKNKRLNNAVMTAELAGRSLVLGTRQASLGNYLHGWLRRRKHTRGPGAGQVAPTSGPLALDYCDNSPHRWEPVEIISSGPERAEGCLAHCLPRIALALTCELCGQVHFLEHLVATTEGCSGVTNAVWM